MAGVCVRSLPAVMPTDLMKNSFTFALREYLHLSQRGLCVICGKKTIWKRNHILPKCQDVSFI